MMILMQILYSIIQYIIQYYTILYNIYNMIFLIYLLVNKKSNGTKKNCDFINLLFIKNIYICSRKVKKKRFKFFLCIFFFFISKSLVFTYIYNY